MQIRNFKPQTTSALLLCFCVDSKSHFYFLYRLWCETSYTEKGTFVSSFVTFTLLAKHTGVLDFGCQRFPLNCKSLFFAREQFLLTIIRLCF